MARIYYDADANLDALKGKTIAIIGYGNQGEAHARNLRDSRLNVIVSDLPKTPRWELAEEHGFKPTLAEQAAEGADVIMMLVPDTIQPSVYRNSVAKSLLEGKAIGFAHGFNIHFNQIVPPPDIDVFMVAPKGPGTLVRKMYEDGKGVPALIAVHQDYTKNAKQIALAYAKGLGVTRAGVIETTFAEETETDLFGEQCVLCGGCTELIRAGFETLVEAGYQPEVAYFECLHELKLIVDLIYAEGICGMRKRISDTAEYGDITRGKRVINESSRGAMKEILREVRSGEFAREWILENQAGRPVYNAEGKRQSEHPIEQVGKRLREMMPWMKKQ